MDKRLALVGLLTMACRGEAREGVALTLTGKQGVDLSQATWQASPSIRRVDRSPRDVTLTLDPGSLAPSSLPPSSLPPKLDIRAPGACPVEVSLEGASPGDRRRVELSPWIDVGEDRPQVGFDTAFEIEVRPGCREAVAGRITWRVVSGALAEMREEKNGFRLRGRTVKVTEGRRGSMPWGIVPWSPSNRGAVTLEATWKGVGPTTVRTVHLAAVARASGVSSVPIGQTLLLGGSGFRVVERPPEGRAEIKNVGGIDSFTPDAGGRWILEDAARSTLALRAGRHADTPLDCGRAECHASAAEGASHTRMTAVLANGLRGALGAGYDAPCALSCHAVGEPGLRDGGFVDVMRELGASLPAPGPEAWESLPRPLRRLGGVGCTACHGPGAIPAPSMRAAILRTDVCATCHDAPPRYGHVAALSANRMARADAAPETRREAKCRACHTTAGFLDAIGVRPASMSEGEAREPHGLGCAACHAPHAQDPLPKLVRRVAPPASLGEAANRLRLGASAVCLRCHAPLDGEASPSASAASLWLGRAEGAEAAPHAQIQNGCLGCHAKGAPEVQVDRGAGHAFQVDRRACEPCHDCPREERLGKGGKRVRDRAEALFGVLKEKKIIVSARSDAPHAAIEVRASPGSPEAKAAFAILTVLEDPAAAAHDAAYARRLLDDAETALTKAR